MKTKRKKGYVQAPQFEMPIDGGFRLITEETTDGERVVREREQKQRQSEESAAAQLAMF